MPKGPIDHIHIVFDAPPGPGSAPQFQDVEGPDGRSINIGDWIKLPNTMWALRIYGSFRPRALDEIAAQGGAEPEPEEDAEPGFV